MSINTWAVAVVRYNAGVIGWNKMELEEMDRNTRQLLIWYGVVHPRANVLRLYTPRKLGGRGLIGVEECVANEGRPLDLYVASSEEELLKYIATTNNLVEENIEGKGEYRRRVDVEKKTFREAMPLHGQFERDTKTLKTEESWDWLSKGDLKRETESFDSCSRPSLKHQLCPKEHLSSSRVG